MQCKQQAAPSHRRNAEKHESCHSQHEVRAEAVRVLGAVALDDLRDDLHAPQHRADRRERLVRRRARVRASAHGACYNVVH